MKQMTLADWTQEDCPEFDLSQHMNPPETLDRDQVEEDHLPTDRPTDRPLRVLVACEESQTVCKAFRERGHEAYSCDVIRCSGGHPEWHIMMDARAVINGGVVRLQNGTKIEVPKWDIIIAHPPCTYLTNVATKHHSLNCSPINWINARTLNRIEAMRFFMDCVNAQCDRVAIENPIGIMNTAYRKPDQIIHPYYFAESENDTENYATKSTCLWLKGLDPLRKKSELPKPKIDYFYPSGKRMCWEESVNVNRACVRSKTFPGVAKAMAEQWG